MADGGGPTEQCRSEGMPSLGEAPSGGARAFGYLALLQVTRRKGGTNSRHHQRNGYTPNPNPNPNPPRPQLFKVVTDTPPQNKAQTKTPLKPKTYLRFKPVTAQKSQIAALLNTRLVWPQVASPQTNQNN
ncbi:hypothetical protein EJA72_15340 [Pseudomonas sp. PB120]|nr:hypothetical protein [Pseudomonas sp. PB120]